MILALASPLSASAAGVSDLSDWQPASGDRLLIDVEQNIGFLIHEDGEYVSFPVATGQRRVVRYIGKTYFAATPLRSWTITGMDMKDDRNTFGTSGRFFRLMRDSEKTPYGIHGHVASTVMLGSTSVNRYRSMGCVIVSEEVLDILARTLKNNGSIDVLTSGSVSEPVETAVKSFLDKR